MHGMRAISQPFHKTITPDRNNPQHPTIEANRPVWFSVGRVKPTGMPTTQLQWLIEGETWTSILWLTYLLKHLSFLTAGGG